MLSLPVCSLIQSLKNPTLLDHWGPGDRILRFTYLHVNFIMIFPMLLLEEASFQWSAPRTAAIDAFVGSYAGGRSLMGCSSPTICHLQLGDRY